MQKKKKKKVLLIIKHNFSFTYLQMNSSTTEADLDAPPAHLFSDYIEIVYLATALVVGIPTNVYILTKLFRDRRQAQDHSIKVCYKCLFKFLLFFFNVFTLFLFVVFCSLFKYELLKRKNRKKN